MTVLNDLEVTVQFLAALAGVLILVSYIPYIRAILLGETKPSKASWLIWACLDTITIAAMYTQGTLNFQITGTIFGVWTVAALALWWGKPGWTMLDKSSMFGAALAVVLWHTFDSPTLGLAASLAANFIGSVPTLESIWNDPARENKTAWTLCWLSCVCATVAVPSWSFDTLAQPITFLIVNSTMMVLLFIKPRLMPAT